MSQQMEKFVRRARDGKKFIVLESNTGQQEKTENNTKDEIPKQTGETFTITCAEAGENHQGMELIGEIGEVGTGWKLENLEKARIAFE